MQRVVDQPMVSSLGFDIDYSLSARITESISEVELAWSSFSSHITERTLHRIYIPPQDFIPTVHLGKIALPYDLWESRTLHSARQIPPPVPTVPERSPSIFSPSIPSIAKVNICLCPLPHPSTLPSRPACRHHPATESGSRLSLA